MQSKTVLEEFTFPDNAIRISNINVITKEDISKTLQALEDEVEESFRWFQRNSASAEGSSTRTSCAKDNLMNLSALTASEITQAVNEYNRRYSEMDRTLWCLSKHCRESLIDGQSTIVVETLVWTIRSWWGVQGARKETKTLLANALSELSWTPDLFSPLAICPENVEVSAYDLVSTLVETARKLGVSRREYSLASKVLHWLLPWRIPIYDSFVRSCLEVPNAWDHPEAYRAIASKMFAMARKFSDEAQNG